MSCSTNWAISAYYILILFSNTLQQYSAERIVSWGEGWCRLVSQDEQSSKPVNNEQSSCKNNSVNCFVRGWTLSGSIPNCQSAYFRYMAAVRTLPSKTVRWTVLREVEPRWGSIPNCQSAYSRYMAAVRGIEPLFREWESLVLTTRRYRFMQIYYTTKILKNKFYFINIYFCEFGGKISFLGD